ncbi:MAG: hypothetical protein LBD73_05945, partial [Deferribacteraceae bacterium]|nr:hypothetical protein [Deferribacteraceae bacterium]
PQPSDKGSVATSEGGETTLIHYFPFNCLPVPSPDLNNKKPKIEIPYTYLLNFSGHFQKHFTGKK